MDRPPPSKRPRLSMACNICRQRKVKCDADYPKCRNCRVRNQTCITTDPQRPGCPGVREWLDVPEKQPLPNNTSQESPEGNLQSPGNGTSPPQDNHNYSQVSEAQEAPAEGENEVSPVHQRFDTAFNIEHGTNRVKVMGGSSSQCLAKSLDIYFKTVRMKPVSGFFRHGMRHAEELELSLALMLPDFPDPGPRDRYVAAFRSRIQPLYPVVQLHNLQPGLEQLAARGNFRSLSREQIPILVMTYLILSLGADEDAHCPTEEGEHYLHAAASLLSHVIVIPYLPAVQTLLLFTMAYRGRNQEGLAWQHLGMAIRIAYTLGVHLPSKRPPEQQNRGERELHARVWAVCCCLETLMHLESGRPTTIHDEHMAKPSSLLPEYRFTRWHLGLSSYQGSISHHIYNHNHTKGSTRNVRQILLDTASLDRALLSWTNQIPPELRPGNDIVCAKNEFHIVAFLSIQYHATMIALHRAALIAPTSTFEAEVSKHCADDPSQFRIANGESICVNSARAIAKLSIELPERGADSCLIPAGPAVLACIVLAIYLMKHPGSRLQTIDLQLLRACLTYSSMQMAQSNTDPRFMQGLAVICDQIQTYLDSFSESVGEGTPRREGHHNNHTHNPKRPYEANPNPNPSPATRGPSPKPKPPPGNMNAAGQLPTPSTYEARTPTHRTSNEGYRAQVNGNHDIQAVPNGAGRGYVDPVTGTETAPQAAPGGGWQLSEQERDIQDEMLALQGSNGFLDGLGSDINEVNQFPFEGFNVGDLWNWMLYLDSPGESDIMS